jgi:DNA-binding GntR family transcriptional regulator
VNEVASTAVNNLPRIAGQPPINDQTKTKQPVDFSERSYIIVLPVDCRQATVGRYKDQMMLETDDPFTPINQHTLRKSVTDSMRQAIVGGVLRPGEQINQVDVASRLRVSRAPVREALRQLEEEGLVLNLPHKGTFVTEITTSDIEEVYSVRRVLENFAIQRAIEQVSDDDLNALSEIVSEMAKAAEIPDASLLRDLDLQFHLTICKCAHHQLLLQLWKSIEVRVRRVVALRHGIYKDPRDIVGSHPDILKAIQAKDVERAANLMDIHIREAGELLLAAWLNP